MFFRNIFLRIALSVGCLGWSIGGQKCSFGHKTTLLGIVKQTLKNGAWADCLRDGMDIVQKSCIFVLVNSWYRLIWSAAKELKHNVVIEISSR